MDAETKEMTLDDVISLLDKDYELVYVDYRDSLDGSEQAIQDAIQEQDWCKLDGCIDEYWLMESQDQSLDYILEELKDRMVSYFDLEDEEIAEQFIQDNLDYLRDTIYDRDSSTPLSDMMRHTDNPVCFYDTGLDIDECGYDNEMFLDNITAIKELLKITDDKFDRDLEELIMNASYGGRLVVYFREDIEALMKLDKCNVIRFKNPALAVIDTYNGSGHNVELSRTFEFSLPFTPDNIFLDKTIKYNYTYQVCGMSSDWCDCTTVYFETVEEVQEAPKSTLHAEQAVEELYNKAYKAGGCTFGDMDMSRHHHTYYDNNFPCGTHCKDCGTFWID